MQKDFIYGVLRGFLRQEATAPVAQQNGSNVLGLFKPDQGLTRNGQTVKGINLLKSAQPRYAPCPDI